MSGLRYISWISHKYPVVVSALDIELLDQAIFVA